VVRLSALRIGRLYPQKYSGTHFDRLSRPRAHGLVGCLIKNPQWHDRGSIRGPSHRMWNVDLSRNKTVASHDSCTRNGLSWVQIIFCTFQRVRERGPDTKGRTHSLTHQKGLWFWISKLGRQDSVEIWAKAHKHVCYGSRYESASFTKFFLRNSSSAVPKNSPKFHGTRRFITVFSKSHYLPQSSPVQTSPVHALSHQFFQIYFNITRKLSRIFVANSAKLNTTLGKVIYSRTQSTCTCAQSSPIDRISVNPADHDD
jgi:hypothetical protein